VVVAQKQFAPLLAGIVLMHFAPGCSTKVRRPLLQAIAAYALVAPLVMALFAKWMGRSPASVARSQG
jgi:hypothetical protein